MPVTKFMCGVVQDKDSMLENPIVIEEPGEGNMLYKIFGQKRR